MARRERSDGKILDFKEIMFTLTLNGNIFVGNLVLLIACLMFGYQGAQIGTIIYAQNTLLRQICDLNIYLVEGLGFATETLVGNFY